MLYIRKANLRVVIWLKYINIFPLGSLSSHLDITHVYIWAEESLSTWQQMSPALDVNSACLTTVPESGRREGSLGCLFIVLIFLHITFSLLNFLPMFFLWIIPNLPSLIIWLTIDHCLCKSSSDCSGINRHGPFFNLWKKGRKWERLTPESD